MVLFYEKDSWGWNNLRENVSDDKIIHIKLDFNMYLDEDIHDEENTIYYYERWAYFAYEGVMRPATKQTLYFLESKIVTCIGTENEIILAVDEDNQYTQGLTDFFSELAVKYNYSLHLIYLGEWEGVEVSPKGLLRMIKNADQYKSICFMNRYGFVDYEKSIDDIFEEIKCYEELISDDIKNILLKAERLESKSDHCEVYLYNHRKQVYQLVKLQEHEITRFDAECFGVYEFVFPNEGKKTCLMLKAIRRKYAKRYHEILREEPCKFDGECRGTCFVCENITNELWKKNHKYKEYESSDAYAPVRGIERLRIGTDGEGIRTLVAMNDCMLNCQYCINRHHINIFPFYKKTSVKQLGKMLEKDAVYFEMTGGGITFGGGEPLLYPDFIQSFHRNYPEWKIDVQTSLNVPFFNMDMLLDIVDVWHIDIKDMNQEIYEAYTGCSNEIVIKNLKILCKKILQNKINVRVPHIPGYNCRKDIEYSISVLTEMGIENIEEFNYII